MGSIGEGSPKQRHQSPLLSGDTGDISREQNNNNNTTTSIMENCCNIKNEQFETVRDKNLRRRRRDLEEPMEQSRCSSGEEGGGSTRVPYAKCTSNASRSHNTRNLFSLGNGLILILLIILLHWTCLVHGGFPGRGPPPPRGPPLLARHPLAPGGHHSHGHSRNSPFSRRNRPPPPPPHAHHHPHHHNRGPPPNKHAKHGGPPNDLAVAAQTLYDLRGYHVPLSGPDAPRFHRQNDPFTLPTPLAGNPRERPIHHLPQDSRTAPLVFPSFYQEQPTPTPTRSSIFGHNQHLSQTRFEPPGSFHLGGNSASTKITLEQQSSSSRDQFRPSQIDISLHNNLQSTPIPASPSSFHTQSQVPSSLAPEKKNIVGITSRTRTPVKLSKNHHDDPFAYIYDEVDYDEADDSDFTLDNRQRTPQGQINSNRITPSTSTTTVSPLRSREPTIVPTPSSFPTLHSQQQPQYLHQGHQALYSTSTTTKQPTTTQNNIYYNPQKDDYRDPFRNPQNIIRPPVTPRPNVEIVPSSERKPPPDQSNAIVPALARLRNEGRDYNRGTPAPPQTHQIPLINDNFRRPVTTTTTTTGSPPPTALAPQYQRESIYNIQPQGRQVSSNSPQTPVPYFPAGLDRRPFETQNEIPTARPPPVRNGQTQNHFDQVVNILQEEEEQYRSQNNNNPAENLLDQGFNTPSKLRPVNTLIPKNRFPKEDILLPPNFLFTHGLDNTTPRVPINSQQEVPYQRVRGDITQQRVREQNQVTRVREELPRIRDEPRVPVREPQRTVPPTQQPIRTRPSVIFPDEYEDDNQNFINHNQHHSQVITEPPPPPPPSRSRGRQPTLRTTTTTTPAPEEQNFPQRSRTQSARQRLRPNYTRQPQTTTPTTTTSTTTTTTTTTPVPTYVEYPSQEYLDDYENPRQQYQQSPSPPQILSPVVPQQQPKTLSRFPPFPNKNKEQEVVTTTTTPPQSPPLQRQRPQVTNQERPQGRQRAQPVKSNRFRETTTQDSATSPRTTGKPLYTTGRMLSKEGGLYAGQQISAGHVYGKPVPNIPINSVFDKMPGVLDGKSVILATSRPNFGSSQKHLRSKQRPQPEHGPPKRNRPTARPLENSLDIVETVTLKPVDEQPKRLRAGNQFVRGNNGVSQENSEQSLLPKRRKARPGQQRPGRQQQQQQVSSTGSPSDPYTETVSIHPPTRSGRDRDPDNRDERTSSFQTERAQIIREPSVETTTSVATSPRSRRPRPPRPGQQGGRPNSSSQQENVSERSRESSAVSEDEDKPQKPVRKLRPRLRPVPQLNPQQQRGLPSEVVTQSQSAQVDRKPTEGPGRFSSRFREDEPETSTVSSGHGRFSPSASRPTFKLPPAKKQQQQNRNNKRPHQQQQQQQQDDTTDELPDSIKLSPKDVIANRKPARRIPPGSASDRLKSLQQRRNKVFGKPGQQQQGDGEETAEDRQVPVTKQRPRLKSTNVSKPPPEDEDDNQHNLPQPQRLRTPPRHQSQEASGSKREIANRATQQQNHGKPPRNDVDYYNNKSDRENDNNRDDFDDDNSEYTNDDQGSSSPPSVSVSTSSVTPQTERAFVTVTSRPVQRPHNIGGGFQRNKSIEVTSDEARSVLGIPRPAAPNRAQGGKRLRLQQQQSQQQEDTEEEEDEQEEEQEAERQQFRQRPRFNNNNNNRPRQRFNEEEEGPRGAGDREVNTLQPEIQQPRQLQRPIIPGGRPHKQQQRPKLNQRQQEDEEEEDAEQDISEYREDNDDEDKEQPARKSYLHHQKNYVSTSSIAPSPQILRKKLNTNHHRNTAEQEDDDVEVSSPPSAEKTTVTSTSTSSTSTSTSTSTSPFPTTTQQAEPLPVALPVRQPGGPRPIKQGVLKGRLRPNRRLNGAAVGGGPQPRVSLSVTTTEATITTTETRKVGRNRDRGGGAGGRIRGDAEEGGGLRHGTIHVSKTARPRLHGGGSGKRKEKKFIAMATENPSLPLESMFPETS